MVHFQVGATPSFSIRLTISVGFSYEHILFSCSTLKRKEANRESQKLSHFEINVGNLNMALYPFTINYFNID